MTIEEIVSEVFNVSKEEVTEEKKFFDFAAWDSMSHMMLITTVEDSFQIQFEGEEIITMETIGQLKTLVSEKSTK
ncbi:acyl carrier protein [uncultured Roseivirga sp.]|uniref:acyl carrier protein n=1 Tax=uncultured Roseivirga sp. TaxID=543088 RepID=UPI000D7A7FE9|nr:acyl carrier protein [uncultured Roseivirga sp.]PWL27235.1 MAG: hypothetical protein DCO95_17975 [Roseivirga sp. XM-24bin3]